MEPNNIEITITPLRAEICNPAFSDYAADTPLTRGLLTAVTDAADGLSETPLMPVAHLDQACHLAEEYLVDGPENDDACPDFFRVWALGRPGRGANRYLLVAEIKITGGR